MSEFHRESLSIGYKKTPIPGFVDSISNRRVLQQIGGRINLLDNLGTNSRIRKVFKKVATKVAKVASKVLPKVLAKRVQFAAEGPKKTIPDGIQRLITETNNIPIVGITLGRKPIDSMVYNAMNVMSLGEFNKVKNKLGYDNVFHNYIIVELANGQKYKLEKNEMVQVSGVNKNDYNGQMIPVDLKGKQIDIESLIGNASSAEGFWHYKSTKDHCQKFTRDLIEKNGLLPDDPAEAEHFQLQDAETLIDTLPGGSTIIDHVTDAANVGRRFINGEGIRHQSSPGFLRTSSWNNLRKLKLSLQKNKP